MKTVRHPSGPASASLLLLALLLSGCGGDLVIEGSVKLNNLPVNAGTLVFRKNGDSSPVEQEVIVKDGRFLLAPNPPIAPGEILAILKVVPDLATASSNIDLSRDPGRPVSIEQTVVVPEDGRLNLDFTYKKSP